MEKNNVNIILCDSYILQFVFIVMAQTCRPIGPGGPGKPLEPSSPFCPNMPCCPLGPGSPSPPLLTTNKSKDLNSTAVTSCSGLTSHSLSVLTAGPGAPTGPWRPAGPGGP